MNEEKNEQPLYWEFENAQGYLGAVGINTKDKEVRIGVEDDYYNFKIPFDTFLEIAEKVKEKISNGKSNN